MYVLVAALVTSPVPTTAFLQPCPLVRSKTRQTSSCPFLLPNKKASPSPAMYMDALFAQKTELDNKPTSFGPSAFFLVLTATLSLLLFEIQDSPLPNTIGILSLFFVTSAVGYDNLIIGLGSTVFSDARTDKKVYNILKWLSYPRFIFHAVRLPFLCSTAAEIGRAAGVEWLQSDLVQNSVVAVAAVLAALSRIHFFQSPGIELADTSDSPPDALERQLLWFTYKEPDFLYNVGPSILLALWSIVVGVATFRLAGGDIDAHEAGIWLIASAVGVLAGNSQKSYVTRFTGNLSEVTMLWCMFISATLVLSTTANPVSIT